MEDMEPGKEEVEFPHAFLVAIHYCCPHLAVEARDQGPPIDGAHRSQPWRGTGQEKTRSGSGCLGTLGIH